MADDSPGPVVVDEPYFDVHGLEAPEGLLYSAEPLVIAYHLVLSDVKDRLLLGHAHDSPVFEQAVSELPLAVFELMTPFSDVHQAVYR